MSASGTDAALLERIETYYDAAPRTSADVEELGALTLFVSRIPWRYYGRPRLGMVDDIGADDIGAVRARQRELGVREQLEWVDETTPSLAGAAQAAGLEVKRVPLLALDAQAWRPAPEPQGATVRMLRADDPVLSAAQAAVELAFGSEDAGPAERDAAVAGVGDLGFLRDRLHRGLTAMAVAEDDADGGVLAAGSHQPVGAVSEVVGVGTLPSARRRGIGLGLTGRLVEDAISRGVGLVFLSAADEGVARLYERVGFRRVGTACFAGPAA